MIEKPLVTVSGKKILFNSNLHHRITQDLPQEGVEWRRRLDSNSKFVYIDVDFVDFDVDNVERLSERLSRSTLDCLDNKGKSNSDGQTKSEFHIGDESLEQLDKEAKTDSILNVSKNITEEPRYHTDLSQLDKSLLDEKDNHSPMHSTPTPIDDTRQLNDASTAFFNQKLLGRPILHTYWADKTDFDGDNQKTHFDDWIGKVQASTCTEWAIIIIEDGDFKAQFGTALFKSKLQSSASQANVSSSSIASMTQHSSSSFLDRMKKGLSTMFQSDSNSDRWLTLINQDRLPDSKVQESYDNFIKKFRNIIMTSFSKQIELFEEQLRVQREMRTNRNWNFFNYFSMQEELAFAFEFLTLFDEALVQYELLDALFTEYVFSSTLNNKEDQSSNLEQWTRFTSWQGLCLDLNSSHSEDLRKRIVDRKASLLELRNYLFAKQCNLMLTQNQPWRVAASANIFIQERIREHEFLNIDVLPGALTCWSFISALEVLQKCECYSCTSTMENYSLHTVDIWNCARKKLIELGNLVHQMPDMEFTEEDGVHIAKLLDGLGPDPHNGLSYQQDQISPHARLRDALAGREQYSKHLIDISELTLGTYKHIGRKRHATLVGKELADFYMKQGNHVRALPFMVEMGRILEAERWELLLEDVRRCVLECNHEKSKRIEQGAGDKQQEP